MSVAAEPVLPTITDLNRPFWDACAAGELHMQTCADCTHVRYPIAPICPRCLSPDYEWRRLSGRGEIYSWVYFQRGYHAAWEARLPYNVILVRLDEGPRMFSNALPLSRNDLRVGMPVQVTFEREGGMSIPRFRPVTELKLDSDH